MSYVDAPKNTLSAAAASFIVTLVVSASIVFGMAGLPDDHGAAVARFAPAAAGVFA